MSELSRQYEDRARFADFGGRRPTAFVDADRHTARVQFLRRAIVVGCVSAVGLIGFILAFDPLHRLQIGFSLSGVGLEGTRITMEHPRLSGYRSDGQPYEIRAETVVQDTRAPKLFDLQQIDAKLGLKDGSTTSIRALKGRYDSEHDHLDLSGSVRVRNEGRYDMNLKSAAIDMRNNGVVSHDPVVVTLPGGHVDAAGASFEEKDQRIDFEGPVRSEFVDKSPETPATSEGASQ